VGSGKWKVGEGTTSFTFPFLLSPFRDGVSCRKKMNNPEKFQIELDEAIEKLKKLDRLLDVTKNINSTLNKDELLKVIMHSAEIVMDAEASSLMMLDEETGELVFDVATGPVGDQVVKMRIPKGKGIAGSVAETGEIVIVEDAKTDKRFYASVGDATGFVTKSLVCVPVRVKGGKIIGVLQVLNKKDDTSFMEADGELLSTLADQAAIAIENARLYSEAREKQLLEHQLMIAQQVQQSLLPEEPPEIEGIEIAAINKQASHLGGDYYDFIQVDGGELGIVIGDVSGKNVPAAIMMATARAFLRSHVVGTYTNDGHSLTDIISFVNHLVCDDTEPEKYMTLFYGMLNVPTIKLAYVNCGHNWPVLYNPAKDTTNYLKTGGLAVGMIDGVPYAQDEVPLEEGDILVLYTDGVTEAFNEQEELFGEERLLDVVKANSHLNAQGLLDKIVGAVMTFAGKAEQSDDVTLVILKVKSNE